MGFIISFSDSEFIFNPSALESGMLWSANNPFMHEGWDFGRFLIEPGKLTMSGYEKNSYWFLDRSKFEFYVELLQNKITADSDLLKYRYKYSFKGNPSHDGPVSSGCSGFRIENYFGSIRSHPRQFLTLTLSEIGPSGNGRPVQFIDMRNRESINTDWGLLRVHRKEHEVKMFKELDALSEFLNSEDVKEVKVEPMWQSKN